MELRQAPQRHRMREDEKEREWERERQRERGRGSYLMETGFSALLLKLF